MLRIAHIHVGYYIHNAAVCLLGQTLVKASVACLHVEHRYMQSLCANDRQARICVPQNKHCIRFFLFHKLVRLCDYIPHGFAQIFAHRVQVVIGSTQTQIIKKDLIQSIIVILPGVHQNLVKVLIACLYARRKTNYLGSCSYYCH